MKVQFEKAKSYEKEDGTFFRNIVKKENKGKHNNNYVHKNIQSLPQVKPKPTRKVIKIRIEKQKAVDKKIIKTKH